MAPLGELVYIKIREIVRLEDWLYEVIEDLVYFGKVEFTLDNGIAHNLEELIYIKTNRVVFATRFVLFCILVVIFT